MVSRRTFPYGASYSPLIYPEEEWARDLTQMQAAHMNLVRIGDVHGSWDRIEPREGDFNLEVLARFYQAAAEFGVSVLLSTGTSSPPLWLVRKYPDVSLLSSRGERYPLGASYHWACINHPGFLQAATGYVRKLAAFAGEQPNHFGWQISNEIGFPFMPARESHELGLYCYCEHCLQDFQEWAKAKYGTLEALTDAWSWSTTNFVYNSWDDIFAPEGLPASWSGVTRWIDWRLYCQGAFANFARWQHDLIREIDEDHPTSVNTFNFKGYDRFGTFMGLDQWQIAQQVDHIGYDLYPGSGDKRKTRPEHNSIFLDHGRSVAASVGRDFWIHETESGPIGGWLLGPEYNTRPRDILNNGMEVLGHAAKLVIYMPWREWGYQPIHWGALVDLNSKPSPRLEAAGTLGKFIADHHDFLLAAKTPPSEIAILESKPNAIFLRGVNQEEVLFTAQRGAYRGFWDLGYSVDFITPGQLTQEKLAGYKYVCLPLLGLLRTQDAQVLQEYVAAGGVLVGFSRCAALDERGWYHNQLPIPGLKEAFGLKHIEPDTLAEPTVHFGSERYTAWMNRDLIETEEGTEVLARFSDGAPAVTLAQHGQGYGVYIATQADAGYFEAEAPLLQAVLEVLNDRLGIEPRARTVQEAGRAHGIDHHFLESDLRAMVLFSNYSKKMTAVRFCLKRNGREPVQIVQNFPVEAPMEWEVSGGNLEIQLSFEREEVKAIEITWK